MSLSGWTGPPYIQHGDQTMKFFKKPTLFDSRRINFVPEGKTAQKSAKLNPRKIGELAPTLGPVRDARTSPAIFRKLLNRYQPHFPGRRQTAWAGIENV